MAAPQRRFETGDAEPLFLTRYDVLESGSISAAVADAVDNVADGAGDFVLYDHVDPDAIDRLFDHGTERASWTLTFSVQELVVSVDSDGWISVRRQ